jgi:hypothetical protein
MTIKGKTLLPNNEESLYSLLVDVLTMGEGTITTGVDDLIAYLQGKDRVAMQDAAAFLNVPLDTLQAWTDFLVEEKILGLEYKFTKPFIYLNKEEKPKKNKLTEQTAVPLSQIKQEFEDRARAKLIPAIKIPELWRSHVTDALGTKKAYFFEQASRRHLEDVEQLWEEYQRDLLSRC